MEFPLINISSNRQVIRITKFFDHSKKNIMEWYFHVVLFILYKVVLIFKSVDEPSVYGHSNESYWAVLSCGTDVYDAVQGGSNF